MGHFMATDGNRTGGNGFDCACFRPNKEHSRGVPFAEEIADVFPAYEPGALKKH